MTRKQSTALVKSFVAQYDLELQNAVLLLGGSAALMRLQRFRRTLSSSNANNIRLYRELNWLHDLLSLEHVGDFTRDESGHFALINPDDPIVWAICVLTEAVGDLIEQIDDIRDAAGNQSDEVAA